MVCYECSLYLYFVSLFFFFKQKTAYEMRISDWSSDVCSSDLNAVLRQPQRYRDRPARTADHRSERRGAVKSDYDVIVIGVGHNGQIGRASCRERVCQYV